MRRLMACAVAALMAVGANADARELRSSTAAPEASPWGKVANAYAAKVAELSGGKLTIKTYFSSELGDEQTVARQVARGRLDMAGLSNTATSLLVPEFGLLSSPYAFENLEMADCVADNHLISTFSAAFDEAGVVTIAFLEVGYQIIFSKDPVKKPSDFKGMKVRAAPTKTDTLYLDAAGASAVPLGTTDSMPALKTGNVNAATWPTVYGIAIGTHKIAPHVVVTNHVHQIGTVIISKKIFDSLSEEEKGWVMDAGDVFKGFRPVLRGASDGLLKKIEGAGVPVYRPTEAEMAEWVSVAAGVQPQIVEEMGGNSAATWTAIEAAKKACGG